MFYVNRMIQHFTAQQEIPTVAMRPRNDIYGGAVQDSAININLPVCTAADVLLTQTLFLCRHTLLLTFSYSSVMILSL